MPVAARHWLAFTLLAALLDWLAVGLSLLPLEYLAKPATLGGAVGYARALRGLARNPRLARWLEVGLALSLLGDICLMFEGERWFLGGLLAFLLAHLAYIVALGRADPLPHHPALAPLSLAVAAVALPVMARVVGALRLHGRGALVGPVLAYGAIISTMLVVAWTVMLRPGWSWHGRALAAGGASLFYLSDAVLAWNRFVTPLPAGRLVVMTCYHTAQIALASLVALAPARPAAP